jgi:hypothetical protein
MTKPRWIKPIYNEKLDGQDYLGLRLVQERMVGHLLPGIITITPRARYYAFYIWLIAEYAEQHPAGWSLDHFIRHREQIFGLANVAYNESVAGLAGSRRFVAHWQVHQRSPEIPLSVTDYLQAPRGGYDAYAGVIRVLGLLTEFEEVAGWKVTFKGQELAAAFAQAIAHTNYYRERHVYDEAGVIPADVLLEYGRACSLDNLVAAADLLPLLELLMAWDVPAAPDPAVPDSAPLSNMRATIGLLLEMMDQSPVRLTEAEFRRRIVDGSYAPLALYRPSAELLPVLTQWQMFQLRDLHTYALYALWTYFLHWLKQVERAPLDAFYEHLEETLSMTAVAAETGLSLTTATIAPLTLRHHLAELLDAAGIGPAAFPDRCRMFAQCSLESLHPQSLFAQLAHSKPNQPEKYLGATWLMLMALYLRLNGFTRDEMAWYWAEDGGVRRRSLALFVDGVNQYLQTDATVLDLAKWLYRDYVIAQHTIASLDKWRQRQANTFHFRYEDGWFEFVRSGDAGLSAPRIRQALDVLADLDLYRFDSETEAPFLTELGRETLQRILASYHE